MHRWHEFHRHHRLYYEQQQPLPTGTLHIAHNTALVDLDLKAHPKRAV